MAKSQETFSKKEKEKKRLQKRKEKEQRKEERKAQSKSGKSLEDMMAYVDEYGNITSTPPDPTKKNSIKAEEIVLGSRNTGHNEAFKVRTGKVSFFNTSKGYGFIKDDQTQENIFVHQNEIHTSLNENDRVTFETRRGPKGLSAFNVKKV